jgi:hypothetical protein
MRYQLTGSPLMVLIKPEQIKELTERLDKLEKTFKLVINRRLETLDEVTDYDERITDLENIQAEPRLIRLEEYIMMEDRVTNSDVLNRLTRLEDIRDSRIANDKVPHKCPVCNGTSRVSTAVAKADFDGALRAMLPLTRNCEACEGKGIVWG